MTGLRSGVLILVLLLAGRPDDGLDALRGATGIRRGLVCVAGDLDALADALARDASYLVHQLVRPDRVAERRRAASAAGLTGRLVVEAREGDALPYADRFVDLVVSAPGSPVRDEELQRVLAVDGAASVDGKVWRPKPDPRLDEWTHKWHDVDGNPLSRDRVAGPPVALQWAAGPMFADGSIGGKAPRLGGGAFVCVDSVDGALVARSAANGLPRWRAERRLSPVADFVIAGNRVYAHAPAEVKSLVKDRNAREAGPLVAFDLASGREAGRLEKGLAHFDEPGRGGRGISQFLAQGDGILQAVGPDLAWVDAGTGEPRWRRKLEEGYWFSPILLDDRVVAVETGAPPERRRLDNSAQAQAVCAFARADGKPLWRAEGILPAEADSKKGVRMRAALSPLVGAEGLVLLHGGTYQAQIPGFVAALDAATGKELWRHVIPEGEWTNTVESSRVVVREGTAYYLGGRGIAAWDARTGAERFGFHKRPRYAFNGFGECSGSRATANWLIANGLCYWDAKGDLVHQTWAARSACGTGVFPAYGMIFALPTGCDCVSYGRGYLALSSTPLPAPRADGERLVRGAAFGKVERTRPADADWPVFLHDPQRTGSTSSALPDALKELWRVRVGEAPEGFLAEDRRRSERYLGALSAPVAAGDTVLVARPERHQVAALDASTGRERWTFTAGGAVDSPPTVHEGLAIFGCHDGSVYALRLSDGELVWRFAAAPVERKAMLHGQLTSAFPVYGSAIVLGGRVLATAGYHSDLGGIHFWALDPATGKVLAKAVYSGGTAGQRPALNDLLSATADGAVAWLFRDAGFTPAGEVQQPKGRPPQLPSEPVVAFDRGGALARFPHDFRGGSTHGWKGAMRSGGLASHRVCVGEGTSFGLSDPTPGDLHPAKSAQAVVLRAVRGDPKNPLWTASSESLGRKESYGALIKAGGRLYLGGGSRDGSKGFIQIVDASTAKLVAEYPVPSRVVECGLAAAGGRLYAACEDGSVICLGAP